MATIVILAAFLMAPSAATVQDSSSDIAGNSSYNDAVIPPDVTSKQPFLDDGLTPGTDLSPPPTVPEESTGIPPDGDPYDCNITDGDRHIYMNCTFVCQLDEAVGVPDDKPCYLNYTEISTEGPGPTGPGVKITGICKNGQCVPNTTDVADTSTQPSTAGNPSTTGVTETPTQSSQAEVTTTEYIEESPPQSSPAKIDVNETNSQSPSTKTTSTTESASPERPESPDQPVAQREPSLQPPGTQPNNTPVAMP